MNEHTCYIMIFNDGECYNFYNIKNISCAMYAWRLKNGVRDCISQELQINDGKWNEGKLKQQFLAKSSILHVLFSYILMIKFVTINSNGIILENPTCFWMHSVVS